MSKKYISKKEYIGLEEGDIFFLRDDLMDSQFYGEQLFLEVMMSESGLDVRETDTWHGGNGVVSRGGYRYSREMIKSVKPTMKARVDSNDYISKEEFSALTVGDKFYVREDLINNKKYGTYYFDKSLSSKVRLTVSGRNAVGGIYVGKGDRKKSYSREMILSSSADLSRLD